METSGGKVGAQSTILLSSPVVSRRYRQVVSRRALHLIAIVSNIPRMFSSASIAHSKFALLAMRKDRGREVTATGVAAPALQTTGDKGKNITISSNDTDEEKLLWMSQLLASILSLLQNQTDLQLESLSSR